MWKSRGGAVTIERDTHGNLVIEGSCAARNVRTSTVVPAVSPEEFHQAVEFYRRRAEERRRSTAITPVTAHPIRRPLSSARPRGAGRPRAHATRTPSSSSADPGSDDGPAASACRLPRRGAVT
jgi:hypothetical protein